jgi:hypothetical protein
MMRPTLVITLWSRFILQKLTLAPPLKKFSALYGTRMFITVFTRARDWSLLWAKWIQSGHTFHPIFFLHPFQLFRPTDGDVRQLACWVRSWFLKLWFVNPPPPEGCHVFFNIGVFWKCNSSLWIISRLYIFCRCTACRDPQQCAELNSL